jgi:hypothetical protein
VRFADDDGVRKVFDLSSPMQMLAKLQWEAAMEALILVAGSGGPTMFARISVMRALNRRVERVFNPDRKDHHRGRRKLARDR